MFYPKNPFGGSPRHRQRTEVKKDLEYTFLNILKLFTILQALSVNFLIEAIPLLPLYGTCLVNLKIMYRLGIYISTVLLCILGTGTLVLWMNIPPNIYFTGINLSFTYKEKYL